jgi:16S rRNA (guanine966-N2)-methyltransferase
MRIVGGEFRSRVLKAPPGLDTRPILSRVREAVFSMLSGRLVDARVADLFSGSGIIGFEALSRGAASVEFFESGSVARQVIEENASLLRVGSRVTVHRRSLPRAIVPGDAWNLVFVDPPWGQQLGGPAAQAVLAADRLLPDGRLIMRERVGQQDDETTWLDRGFELLDERHYGESAVQVLGTLPS